MDNLTMNNQLNLGDKIQYRLFDKKGQEHWFDGVIHGIRRAENPATNFIKKVTYLVDTGRDERVDEYTFDHRDREISRRINEMVGTETGPANIKAVQKALDKIHDHSDLPESRMDIERVRQPEQLELPAEHIRRA